MSIDLNTENPRLIFARQNARDIAALSSIKATADLTQTLASLCDKKIKGLENIPNKTETKSLEKSLIDLQSELKELLRKSDCLSIVIYRQKQQEYLKLAEEYKLLKSKFIKKTIKNKHLSQGFWSQFLPNYLGSQLAILAALVAGALGIMAIGGVLGTSIIARLLVLGIATSQAFLYFTQEGTSFRKELRGLGQKLDAIVWRDFFKNNYEKILGWTFTIVVTMTLTLLVAFPPLGIASLLASTALPTITLILVTGISSLMACQIFVRTLIGTTHLAKSYFSGNKSANDIKTPKSNKLWQNALPFYLGFPIAIMASLAEGALSYGAIALLVGTGGAAAAIAGVIGSIVGLMYFSQDGTSGIKWLKDLGKTLDNQSISSIKENKWSILETAFKYTLVIGIAAGLAALIAFPPAGIAAGIAGGLATIGLATASSTQIALITFGITALALNVLTSVFLTISHYIAHRIQQKNQKDILSQEVITPGGPDCITPASTTKTILDSINTAAPISLSTPALPNLTPEELLTASRAQAARSQQSLSKRCYRAPISLEQPVHPLTQDPSVPMNFLLFPPASQNTNCAVQDAKIRKEFLSPISPTSTYIC